jgi:hypothetical protein
MAGDDGSGGGADAQNSLEAGGIFVPKARADTSALKVKGKFGDDGVSLDAYDDIMRVTGMQRKQDQEELRLLSYENPKEYAEKRTKAFNKVGLAVASSYKQAYSQHIEAGESDDQARTAAKSAAMNTRNVQEKAFHLRFPDSDNAISISKKMRDSVK